MTRSDSRLIEAVYDALNNTEPLEAAGYRIAVEEKDGVVRLSGVVRTEVHRYLAGQVAAAAVNGNRIQNDLLSDLAIAATVAAALARDPQLASLTFRVYSTLGEVRLLSPTCDPALTERAVAIAREQPGVIAVHLECPQPAVR